jgi:hypothetical protein
MKIISHRGNIIGPCLEDKENRPSYIDCAIQLGLDVEIDIRYIDGNFWLGHDTPDYKVSALWLQKRSSSLWLHCKDINSAHKLKELNNEFKFFCHTSDPYVITSSGHLWVHDLSISLNDNCIIPLLADIDIITYNNESPLYAICTDHVNLCKQRILK